ncbi:hydrolase [uncultured Muriicola sp.]|uniref:hydrolase n=1 Tax=uncultured Muriicola sp. TaxID=1583102 RepID=UPI002635805E|nr:hydrolase [uncultured Muriicola sp.]
MKTRIFLYLFIFSSLIALYLYVSGDKRVAAGDEKITELKLSIEQLEDSLRTTQLKVLDMQYFSLENNDDALVYYDHLSLEDPARYIADKLLETNETKGDNPMIPYEGMVNDFKINKIKVLNHKWIIADFSDGKYWGELFIQYELKDNLSVDFTLADYLLYTRSN